MIPLQNLRLHIFQRQFINALREIFLCCAGFLFEFFADLFEFGVIFRLLFSDYHLGLFPFVAELMFRGFQRFLFPGSIGDLKRLAGFFPALKLVTEEEFDQWVKPENMVKPL